MDSFIQKIIARRMEYEAKLESDPALKERVDNAEAHKCPPWKFRAERSCTVVAGNECRWLIKPQKWLCERCWERMQNKNKED